MPGWGNSYEREKVGILGVLEKNNPTTIIYLKSQNF